jgi:hypothetical protein
MLAASLKGLDKRYHFYAWALPADYVLLGPAGLFALVTKDQGGEVTYRDGRWRQPFRWTRLLTVFAQEGLGNPERDAADQVTRLQRFIAKQWGEEKAAEVPVEGVVIFLAESAQLNLEEEPNIPVMSVKKLKQFIRTRGKGEKLAGDLREGLVELFEG